VQIGQRGRAKKLDGWPDGMIEYRSSVMSERRTASVGRIAVLISADGDSRVREWRSVFRSGPFATVDGIDLAVITGCRSRGASTARQTRARLASRLKRISSSWPVPHAAVCTGGRSAWQRSDPSRSEGLGRLKSARSCPQRFPSRSGTHCFFSPALSRFCISGDYDL